MATPGDYLGTVKSMLATFPRASLEDLRAWLDDILPTEEEVERVLAPGEPPRRVTRRKEMVRCGRPTCRCAGRVELHGPYYYLYWRENGRLRKRYDGRAR